MDDLLSACDTSTPLTRTSSDPNLNNHCQEVRVSLEPWHSSPEGAETVCVESGVGGPQMTVGDVGLPPPLPSSQKDYLSNKPFKGHKSCSLSYKLLNTSVPWEMKSNTSEIKVLEETEALAPDPPAQEEQGRTCGGLGKPPEQCPEKEAVSALSNVPSKCGGACGFPDPPQDSLTGSPKQVHLDSVQPVPTRCTPDHRQGSLCNPPSAASQTPQEPNTDLFSQDTPGSTAPISHQEQPSPVPDLSYKKEDAGKRGSKNGQLLENPRFGKMPLELARKPISQSQISEFSFLGSNWDSFQGMVTSFPSGETTPRRLLAYGCCSKRPGNKHIRAAGPCSGGQWAQREGTKSPVCPSHSSGHCAGPGGKNSRLWLSSHPKQVSSTKPSLLSCPSPVPPLYLDDDGLPFPTDVIQHRLRQIEAAYKQEVEQLRRQVRELQMRLDIRHCCVPPAEPPMDYEDDFVSMHQLPLVHSFILSIQ